MNHNSNDTAVSPDDPREQRFLNERQLAERWGVAVKSIQKMRYAGDGVPYHKFGASVRYAMKDILAFETEARRRNSSESGGGGSGA